MNNEIKEILDKLKDKNWYEELDLTGTLWIELTDKETKVLLDYITNLQERNEKAIEYITKNTEYLDIEKGEVFECEGYKSKRVPIISVSSLLNILKGEDNE